MNATRPAIWSVLLEQMPREEPFELQAIYRLVEASIALDAEDEAFDGVSQTAWKRNVRSLLGYRRGTGEVQRTDTGAYVLIGPAGAGLPEILPTKADRRRRQVQGRAERFFLALVQLARDAGLPYGEVGWNQRTSLRHSEGPLAWVIRVRQHDGQAELLIEHGPRAENARVFRRLRRRRSAIEQAVGRSLVWDEKPSRQRFRIATPVRDGGSEDESHWSQIQHRLVGDIKLLEASVRPYLSEIGFSDAWAEVSGQVETGAWDLVPGDIIKRTALHDRFGGGRQGGIAGSMQTPNVLVFSDPKAGAQFGYHDRWDGPVFHYTGDGQVGDQTLIRGNKAIIEHAETGRSLRLFKGVRGTVRYEGEFGLEADEPTYRADARDRNGDMRKVIVFRMRSLDGEIPVSVQPAAKKLPATSVVKTQATDSTFGAPYVPVDETPLAEPRQPFIVDPDAIDRGTLGHKRTQNALNAFLTAAGISPRSPKPPDPAFDIGWVRGGAWYVAEVKSLTSTNEDRQLRLALGQVLDYQDNLARRHGDVRAVIAVETRPKDPRWVGLCERHGVTLIWPRNFEAVLSSTLTK